MSKLMLIDATHPEETRVAVATDGHIEDFDFEASDKRQLRGNIYLAKVTRVEPSLQAAFVDYGGNRHGFLAFSEIHPDYYQIPKEDREALLAEAAREADEDDADAIDGDDSDDEEGDATSRRHAAAFQRKYKIQEVIRRRQVMLIQIVKEERGNKGAAVTSYLSLAGRYCVLMPNTGRGGGISRKITNAADRKRLKQITSEFELPRGSGLIVRTAGAKRTKIEIRRDFEYLSKLWEQIVSRTMESMAPCLIHEEGHLVLRAVRDLYDKDIEQIVVAGDEAYKEAKNFVRLLMPSHAKKVQPHTEGPPLFVAFGIEEQLDSIFSPVVQLPSGGYIVINQTEALVAIDVNSGKATRERNVEATALRTNMEAAAEACRQMRLRDLAGLIVIDFIDMEDAKNNRAVERKMKDSLKMDRARVQTGRISQFGLFEISRQRRRAGVLELTSDICSHCAGSGRTRSVESAALQLLRAIETRAADDRVDTLNVDAPPDVALYILNEKRAAIATIEQESGVSVRIEANAALKTGENAIEAYSDGEPVAYRPIKPLDFSKLKPAVVSEEDDIDDEEDEEIVDALSGEDDSDVADEVDADADDDGESDDEGASNGDDASRRRRGRRGGRRRRGRDSSQTGLEVIDSDAEDSSEPTRIQSRDGDKRGRGRRRRGRERSRQVETVNDGGEVLDAIASAPFLAAQAAAMRDVAESDGATDDDADASVASTQDAGADQAPESKDEALAARNEPSETEEPSNPTPVESATTSGADAAHQPPPSQAPELEASPDPAPELAKASTAEPAAAPAPESPPAPTPELEPGAAADAGTGDLHKIHAPPPEAPVEAPAPRRTGWWNRRRAG
ncbi:Rne/Rng family ribonuclease [bacterium]|nr:Rne/Rng family ribonuclease [bacterium]